MPDGPDHVGELLVESNCWPQPLGKRANRVQGWTLVLAVAILSSLYPSPVPSEHPCTTTNSGSMRKRPSTATR